MTGSYGCGRIPSSSFSHSSVPRVLRHIVIVSCESRICRASTLAFSSSHLLQLADAVWAEVSDTCQPELGSEMPSGAGVLECWAESRRADSECPYLVDQPNYVGGNLLHIRPI
jgi:hypothetical protein